jgi:predicted acetyltransferase
MAATDRADDWTLTGVRPEERPLLERLGELYLYDFSEFAGWDLGEDGRFDHDGWARGLWADPDHTALLLRVGGKPAGFAIVSRHSPLAPDRPTWYMAEFFVMRRFRRRGIGALVARAVFGRFPGPWHVLQMKQNVAAQAFWRRTIGELLGHPAEEFTTSHGNPVQTFTVPGQGTT